MVMSFTQDLSAMVNKQLKNLQDARDRQAKAAEERARVKLAKARTDIEKEKVKLQLIRERAALDKELYEARTATIRAKEAVQRARKESQDVGGGGQLDKLGADAKRAGGKFYKWLFTPTKAPRRRTVKKTVAVRKTVAAKKRSTGRKSGR